jgi:cysteine desulfurase/selenocysteine lyase
MSTEGAASAWEGESPVGLDVERVRLDFPIFQQRVNGRALAYLDNAATSQKPQCVIDAVSEFYRRDYANVHRGVHTLSQRATDAYEGARRTVQRFINAADPKEIVFVRGTTEGINLVAQTFGRANVGPGDEILLTHMEHHSNIVPWQMLAEQSGAVLRVAPIDDNGDLMLDEYERLLGPSTRLVGIVHVSNALGTINPVQHMIRLAHQHGASVLVDGAQAVPHLPVDVRELDSDFYVFSGHKLYGPSGVGALYGKAELLDAMPPYQGGGDMVRWVTFEKTLYNRSPFKFEAGTPNIEGAVGLAAAIEYVQQIGLEQIGEYESGLLSYANQRAREYPDLRIIGTARHKASILSFVMQGVHAHDIGTIMDHEGVAIRAGHHCAMPVMQHFGVAATARASFAFYNTKEEVDALFAAMSKVNEVLR